MSGLDRFTRLAAGCALFIALAGTVVALPRPGDPIDPSKRAPVSTSDAVRPAAAPPQGTGIIGDGRIPVRPAAVPSSARATPRASIAVADTRARNVQRPAGVRASGAQREFRVRGASQLPASVPRLDQRRFQRTLTAYRAGARPARELVRTEGPPHRVNIADINRYASPRATLERQGIPVVSAASSPAPESSDSPVPVSGDHQSPAH